MKTYPDNLFESIEFDLVRADVAAYAHTAKAKKRLMELQPSQNFGAVSTALTEVNELLGLLQSEQSLPALAAEDVRPHLLRLKIKGAALEGQDVLVLKSLVESFNGLYAFFRSHAERTPTVGLLFGSLLPNKEIPAEVERILDRRGIVKTSASKELGRIRNDLSKKRAAADRIFYRAVKKYQNAGVLADTQESVHENKRVLTVEGAFKGQVNGIFHGSSAKNTQFYVEPSETIEVNNEITLLVEEEQREVTRILLALTAYLATHLELLTNYNKLLYKLDFINAKALYAHHWECCLPRVEKKPLVKLKAAINPVLRKFNAEKGKPVVPLDISLEHPLRMLVISGPNAGGKSITLKTVGLLQVMLQSGLLVPVHPESTMGWFGSVMADIGDAQSIENELSTYSSKLTKMRHFLDASYAKTLVLIDEFGSGSDPELGAAMAQVFLEELSKSKTFGVITTHYNSIKALATSLPGVDNGSMQFNSRDLTPEYVLSQGTPGSSYTFEVAQQVGINKRLIKEARSVLENKTVSMDRLLVKIQREKNTLSKQRKALEDELAKLERLDAQREAQIAKLEDKIKRQNAVGQEQQLNLTWGKRFQSLVNQYSQAKTKKAKEEVLSQFKVYAGERAAQNQAEGQKKKTRYQKQKEKKIQALLNKPAKVGDAVKLIGSRQVGQVAEIKKDQYLLSIGAISTWVTREKFVHADSLHGDPGTGKGKAKGGVKELEKPADQTKKSTKHKKDKKRANAKKVAENIKKTPKTAKKAQELKKITPKAKPVKKVSAPANKTPLTPEQEAQLKESNKTASKAAAAKGKVKKASGTSTGSSAPKAKENLDRPVSQDELNALLKQFGKEEK